MLSRIELLFEYPLVERCVPVAGLGEIGICVAVGSCMVAKASPVYASMKPNKSLCSSSFT